MICNSCHYPVLFEIVCAQMGQQIRWLQDSMQNICKKTPVLCFLEGYLHFIAKQWHEKSMKGVEFGSKEQASMLVSFTCASAYFPTCVSGVSGRAVLQAWGEGGDRIDTTLRGQAVF